MADLPPAMGTPPPISGLPLSAIELVPKRPVIPIPLRGLTLPAPPPSQWELGAAPGIPPGDWPAPADPPELPSLGKWKKPPAGVVPLGVLLPPNPGSGALKPSMPGKRPAGKPTELAELTAFGSEP